MSNPQDSRVGVIRIEGTNCEDESAQAFSSLGCDVEKVHLKQLVGEVEPSNCRNLSDYDALYFPGGFSSGDYVRAGAIFASRMKSRLKSQIDDFISSGKPVLGICNGFQILVESGLVPGVLLRNKYLEFICRNVFVKINNKNNGYFKNIRNDILELHIAHNEGNYFCTNDQLKEIEDNAQVAINYCDPEGKIEELFNPNGSIKNIAGIFNKEKNVLGMMPHPERMIDHSLSGEDGSLFFKNLINNLK